MQQMSEALRAAAESAAAKSAAGSSTTDILRPDSHPIDIPAERIDLTTNYLGLSLSNPLVASPGPIQQSVEGMLKLEEGGVGAIVLFSLFEEQIRHETSQQLQALDQAANSFAEAMTFFPTKAASPVGQSNKYLQLISAGANALTIPLIASINGSTNGDWIQTAKRIQDAGADGLELNIYYIPGDSTISAAETEQRYLDILAEVKTTVSIPVAVKLGPYFSSFGEFARKLVAAGADGLVLFNRFLTPDIDIERQQVVSGLELSTPAEGLLPRTWIAALSSQLDTSFALTSGVETSTDIIKALMAGADVVMTTSALLRHGPSYAQTLLDGLTGYLNRKTLTLNKLRAMLGVPAETPVDEYERSGYLSAIEKAKRAYGR